MRTKVLLSALFVFVALVGVSAQGDTDTVTLTEAMESVGTGDVELFGHSVTRAAPGIPDFNPDLPAGVWDAVEDAVRQHIHWHTDPIYTAHALPGGRERITEGKNLDDPVVYEDPPEEDDPVGVTGVLVGASSDPEVPLSYLLKRMQIGFAQEFVWIARDLISGGVGTNIESSHWTKDNMVLNVGGLDFKFIHLGWDADHTDEEFGPRRLLDSVDKVYHGAGFLAALAGSDEPLDYKQSQTVTVEHSRVVTMDRETNLDIGAEIGTTIGGGELGVSVEAKLTTEFGVKLDNSQTDSEAHSTQTTKEIAYLFPAGRDTLLTLTTRTVQTERHLAINGVSNMGFDVSWLTSLTWANTQNHPPRANLVVGNPLGVKVKGHGDEQTYNISFDTWGEFEETLEGYNTDFPKMQGWLRAAERDNIWLGLEGGVNKTEPLGPHISRIRAPSIRRVVFTGTQREKEDGVLTVEPRDVTGENLGDVKTDLGLPDDLTHDPDNRISGM